MRERLFFVGQDFAHHASHSGYSGFTRYAGTQVRSPVSFRWTLGRLGWPVNQAITRATRHPLYSLGAHLSELHALTHMLRHRRALYHVLYGDFDLWLLRRAHRLTGHGLIASFHQPSAKLAALGGVVERVARHLDAVFLLCEAQRAWFESFMPEQRVFVLPHGVDTRFFRPGVAAAHEPLCVLIGAHLRDYETLRETLRMVWRADPNVRFIGIGTNDDKGEPDLREVGDDRLRLLEGLPDSELLSILQRAHLALFSFRDATANNAILETMACGLPLVATSVGGVPEYVDDRVGALCPPRDPGSLAEAVLGLLGDSERRQQAARAARERALGYDFASVADIAAKAYDRVADLRSGSS